MVEWCWNGLREGAIVSRCFDCSTARCAGDCMTTQKTPQVLGIEFATEKKHRSMPAINFPQGGEPALWAKSRNGFRRTRILRVYMRRSCCRASEFGRHKKFQFHRVIALGSSPKKRTTKGRNYTAKHAYSANVLPVPRLH